jgi:hypothetical protein
LTQWKLLRSSFPAKGRWRGLGRIKPVGGTLAPAVFSKVERFPFLKEQEPGIEQASSVETLEGLIVPEKITVKTFFRIYFLKISL